MFILSQYEHARQNCQRQSLVHPPEGIRIGKELHFDNDMMGEAEETYVDSVMPEFGVEVESEKLAAMEAMVNVATKEGLKPELESTLRLLLVESADIFYTKLVPNMPEADVTPMKVHLKPEAIPKKARPRKRNENRQKLRS